MFQGIWDAIYNNLIVENRYMLILQGLGTTLIISFFSCLLGIVLGLITSVVKVIPKKSMVGKFAEGLANCYITVIRGTPVMVQLLIINFIIFASVNVPLYLVAVIAFGINSGAYVAEIIRSGILSVDHGQMEAGRSLGLNYGRTMRYIVLPQALKNILPALGNEFITLLKETSITGYISIMDLTRAGDFIRSRTYAFTPLLIVAAIYLGVVMLMTWGLRKFERRLRRSDYR